MKQAINLLKENFEITFSHPIDDQSIKKIIEGLLFSTNEPLSIIKIQQVIGMQYAVSTQYVHQLIQSLQEHYQNVGHGFQIEEIAEGFLFRTVEEIHPFVEQLHKEKRGEKLSRAATEVLAIIAHKQPITRREVEEIRGVDCASSVTNLTERGLIEPVGRKNTLGKPLQYGVTKKFLHHYGLKTVQDVTTPTP